MGHYDEQYEAHADAEDKKRKEELLRWINTEIEEMDTHQLGLIYHIAENIDAYMTFFAVLNAKRR